MTDRTRLLTPLHTLSALVVAAAVTLAAPSARAFEPFAFNIPCRITMENEVGTERPCITCHNNPNGGNGCPTPPCHNLFGSAFAGVSSVWSPGFAMLDSDGDGYSNGEELGDPTGAWSAGMPFPTTCACASNPGVASETPAGADADSDGFCCRGRDMNSNGVCTDPGEDDGSFDCDDDDADSNSDATEDCASAADNDCDGLPPLLDPDCASVVDRDADGYCPMGRDMNRDRDCTDLGEDTADVDCDDDEPTVSPAAAEFCVDGLDNDCDTLTDTEDTADCYSDMDMDGDGYCPIGIDMSTPPNGTCDDVGEQPAGVGDCNDGDGTVNPAATEVCTDMLDNDCDGFPDFRDEADCGAFFDADGDGYCPAGRDGNGNGSCTEPGETDDPGDCDDDDPAINPGLMEVCTNGAVDNDCDGIPAAATSETSLDDPDCAGFLDADDDSFCFVGVDMDNDGACISEGEETGDGDCDETNPAINPAATEDCTDMVDNDCDGSTDAGDLIDCREYRDSDGDGYCLIGSDMNADGDCSDPGEQGGLTEWDGAMDPHSDEGTEGNPARYPGAPEHCFNMVDEDLDMMVDESGYCTRDTDMDGDGYCPIGQDIDGDGNCTGPGENIRVTDCNDSAADVNPGEEERCLEPVDADCDGDSGVADSDCFVHLDLDGDGVCGIGVDDNGDGDCLDLSEDRFGTDCDDENPAINSMVREDCADGIDNDCDGDVDQADTICVCETAADCDDGDPCTADMCMSDGECSYTPDPTCGDAGMGDGGMVDPGDDCNCRAAGVGSIGARHVLLMVLGTVAFIVRRRRRTR